MITQLSLTDILDRAPTPPVVLVQSPTCRTTDGGAARDAAQAASGFAGNDRDLVLRCHAAHVDGLTDHEMAAILGRAQTSVGVRRAELTKSRHIAPLLDANGRQVRRTP